MMKKDIIVPAAGESVTEADIAEWLKEDGDFVTPDDPLVELETDKASMPLLSDIAGILTISVEEGSTVNVGDIIGYVTEADAPAGSGNSNDTNNAKEHTQSADVAGTPASVASPTSTYASGHPSPAAAKALAEKNIDPAHVKGSGKDGRITKADALNATTAVSKSESSNDAVSNAPSAPSHDTLPGQPDITHGVSRNVRREKMSRIRRTIAGRLVQAQQETAMLTTFNEVDMFEVMQLRKQYKEAFKDKFDVGLGFMSFFTKACAQVLGEIPGVNAQIDGDELIYHEYADIGIAVATPRGLVVPVVRNAECLTFSQIESSILDYAKRGRSGKITPQDMDGGTFTITNGGVFGSMLSTPILNRPQSAILGMHNIVQRPVVVNGEIVVRPIMYLALSYDHRVIDGQEAVSFLVRVKTLIEEPARLMLSL